MRVMSSTFAETKAVTVHGYFLGINKYEQKLLRGTKMDEIKKLKGKTVPKGLLKTEKFWAKPFISGYQ